MTMNSLNNFQKKPTAFAIQELLGLSTATTNKPTDHQMTTMEAASRMAYLNAHAAVAAAFMPHGLHGHHAHNLLQSGSGE